MNNIHINLELKK